MPKDRHTDWLPLSWALYSQRWVEILSEGTLDLIKENYNNNLSSNIFLMCNDDTHIEGACGTALFTLTSKV